MPGIFLKTQINSHWFESFFLFTERSRFTWGWRPCGVPHGAMLPNGQKRTVTDDNGQQAANCFYVCGFRIVGCAACPTRPTGRTCPTSTSQFIKLTLFYSQAAHCLYVCGCRIVGCAARPTRPTGLTCPTATSQFSKPTLSYSQAADFLILHLFLHFYGWSTALYGVYYCRIVRCKHLLFVNF